MKNCPQNNCRDRSPVLIIRYIINRYMTRDLVSATEKSSQMQFNKDLLKSEISKQLFEILENLLERIMDKLK